ncbi:UNVERIFIED_ORG: hypothetical protein GGI57_001432 [Rhizobium aethiopicum]
MKIHLAAWSDAKHIPHGLGDSHLTFRGNGVAIASAFIILFWQKAYFTR